jgi:hypothetical protein
MLYLAAKPSQVGANVDGLACSLHHPKPYSHKRGGKCCLTSVVLSRRSVVSGGPFSGGAKPLGLDICHGVDHPGTCETESYMEKLTFTRACLSNVRVIMAIMCVPLIELLCQDGMDSSTRVPVARRA